MIATLELNFKISDFFFFPPLDTKGHFSQTITYKSKSVSVSFLLYLDHASTSQV